MVANTQKNRHYSRRCQKLKEVSTPSNSSKLVKRKNDAAEMTYGHLIDSRGLRLTDSVQKHLMHGPKLNYIPPRDDPCMEERKNELVLEVTNDVDCLINDMLLKLLAIGGAKEGKSILSMRIRTTEESPSNKKSAEEGKGELCISKVEEVMTN